LALFVVVIGCSHNCKMKLNHSSTLRQSWQVKERLTE
jgi:hypothetical protein